MPRGRNASQAVLGALFVLSQTPCAHGASEPRMLCYSVQPNAYLRDHARRIAEIYDGFFFNVGSWEHAVERFAGVRGAKPQRQAWLDAAGKNLAALREAGVSENFLTVSFGSNGAWPSPETLLSASFSKDMAAQFAAIGRVARQSGFRGVCIDVEYPYPRYEVDHEIYTYADYTVDDLLSAAHRQGASCIAALLDEYPSAVIFVLPGYLRSRPIGRAYMLGMLAAMAGRDAPGGLHLGTEYTYCLHDPVTALATCRFEDPAIKLLADEKTAKYWKHRCTMAPGVWPLHMIETGGANYPVQAWRKEIAELREQLAILRTAAKRYVWSFTGKPVWYIHSPELEQKYGFKKQDFKRDDIDLHDWHRLLRDKPTLRASRLGGLVDRVRMYDRDEISAEALCDAFGTPGRWWVLGPLGNPHTQPQFSAPRAWKRAISAQTVYHGRDGAVRWFSFDNLDPRGVTSCVYLFDWRNTDQAAAHFVTFVDCPDRRRGYLHVGWDDGIIIRLGDKTVFDERNYPQRGKGMLYRDKHQFERRVPITLPSGPTRLAVTSLNAHGNWVFALRITDENDIPFPDIRFRLKPATVPES